ncbi:MAG: hypothetical protein AVDCRST_MAG34-405, partial [uncultured Nocardioidaceae bacterium]
DWPRDLRASDCLSSPGGHSARRHWRHEDPAGTPVQPRRLLGGRDHVRRRPGRSRARRPL